MKDEEIARGRRIEMIYSRRIRNIENNQIRTTAKCSPLGFSQAGLSPPTTLEDKGRTRRRRTTESSTTAGKL